MNATDAYRDHQAKRALDALTHTPVPLSDDVAGVDEAFQLHVPETVGQPLRRVRVRFEQVGDLPIDRMLTIESVPTYSIPEGYRMGFRCRLCGKSDESLREVEHHERCELKPEFPYEAHEGGVHVFRQVIRADHDLLLLVAGEPTPETVVGGHVTRKGVPVHVWCAECSCGDDALDELEHSEVCSLARPNLFDDSRPRPEASSTAVATDGGQRD